jgi:hypothetical protein
MSPFWPPLAAIDIGVLVTIVIVIITVLGQALVKWREVMQGPGGRPRPGRPNPPPNRPQGQDPVADEIGEFLRRVSERRTQQAPPAQPHNVPPRAGEMPSARPARPRPSEQPAEVILLEADPLEPDGGVAEHVRQHLGAAKFGHRQPELGKEVAAADQKLESHLHQVFDHQIGRLSMIPGEAAKVTSVAPASPTEQLGPLLASAAASVADMFANPTTARQAIVIHEILSRPEHRWE